MPPEPSFERGLGSDRVGVVTSRRARVASLTRRAKTEGVREEAERLCVAQESLRQTVAEAVVSENSGHAQAARW